ncbi:FkbM family methyltransferase [Candidatus Pelagibacter sp.]|nr:FkbM family methyltransferase [Candidatus Pelagibacter sp.]
MKNIDLSQIAGKSVTTVLKKADELFDQDLESKIHAHKIYSILLDTVPNIYASTLEHAFRDELRQKIWNCEKVFFWNEKYFSQAGQDKFIKDIFFKNIKNGFFVEIGAFDGIQGSNCYHFEKFLDWDGIALEPSSVQFQKLKKNRKCKLLNEAVSHEIKEVEFIEVTEGLTQMSGINCNSYKRNLDIISNNQRSKTQSINLKTIIFEQAVPKNVNVDYLSIDIEGGEIDLLNSINFDNNNIKVVSVENNVPEELNFKDFFDNKNFVYFDRVGQDEIFYNSKFFNFG